MENNNPSEILCFSEFPSVRNKTSRTVSLTQFIGQVRSDRYRQVIERYRNLRKEPGREAEAQAVKNALPCVVPAGICQGGHAVKDLVCPSHLLGIDLDHTDLRTQQVLEAGKQLPWVSAAFISPSGEGVKLFVRIRPDQAEQDYAALYQAVGRAVSAHVHHPYDEKCKIRTQPCFYSWHPDAYLNLQATCFEWDGEKSTVVPESGKKDAGSRQEAPSSSDPEATGFLARFLDNFECRNPFRRGNRNDLALKLGRAAGYKGFSKDELKRVIAVFARRYATGDFTAEDIRQRVEAGYQFVMEKSETGGEEPRVHFRVQGSFGPQIPESGDEDPDAVLEKNNEIRATAPYIDDAVFEHLPDLLQRCCRHATDRRERDLMLLGSLNSCSALFPDVRFLYKKSLMSPHFYLAIVAPAGTGKGAIAHTHTLLNPTQEHYERRRREQRMKYEADLAEWELEVQRARKEKRKPDMKLKPEEPRMQYLKISANTSKSRLIESLAHAGETGCCMTTTEINTLTTSLSQDYGRYEDILCKAAHHEEVSMSFKASGEPIVARHPHLAVNMAGTQEQFRLFFRSLEVGLYSRFAFYTRQQNLEWESCAPDAAGIDLHRYFLELGYELYQMHLGLLESPTLVNFSTAQWRRHTSFFGQWLKRALVEGRDSMGGIVYRAGLLCMRLAAILTVFRKWEDYRYAKEYNCTDRDLETALSLTNTLIEHSLLLSTSLPDTTVPPIALRHFHRLESILNEMTNNFTFTEFVQAAMSRGVSESTAKRLLKKSIDMQVVNKQDDIYRKVEGNPVSGVQMNPEP